MAAARDAALATSALTASLGGPGATRVPGTAPASHELMGWVGMSDGDSSCLVLAAASPLSLIRRRLFNLSSCASASPAS